MWIHFSFSLSGFCLVLCLFAPTPVYLNDLDVCMSMCLFDFLSRFLFYLLLNVLLSRGLSLQLDQCQPLCSTLFTYLLNNCRDGATVGGIKRVVDLVKEVERRWVALLDCKDECKSHLKKENVDA